MCYSVLWCTNRNAARNQVKSIKLGKQRNPQAKKVFTGIHQGLLNLDPKVRCSSLMYGYQGSLWVVVNTVILRYSMVGEDFD